MLKLKIGVEEVESIIRILSKCGLKQIVSNDEMVRWFDGDWGTYWYLFKNSDDSMRMDIVHQCDGTTRFGTYFSEKTAGTNKNIFTKSGMIVYTPQIPVRELVKLCTKNGLEFENPEFTYGMGGHKCTKM